MSDTIDKFLQIMRLVNSSDQPVSAKQIADKTKINVRTVQRHAQRLVDEGLVTLKTVEDAAGFHYIKIGLSHE